MFYHLPYTAVNICDFFGKYKTSHEALAWIMTGIELLINVQNVT